MRTFLLSLLLAAAPAALAQDATEQNATEPNATDQDVPAPEAESDELFDDLSALLDEEVETATTYRQRASEAAASVSIITADEIERMGYRTVAEALALVRGFYISDDRNYTYVGVRGFSRPSDYNNRIAVLVDGIPARDENSGAAPLGMELGIPMTAIERIEVVRGPGSTLYGTGAMLAVINVITKDTRVLEGVRALASGGEYGTYRGEIVAATSLPGGAAASISLFGLDADGADLYFSEFDAPQTNGGVASDLDWERAWGGMASAQTDAVQVQLRFMQRDKGVPTASYESEFGLPAFTRDRSANAALRVQTPLSSQTTLFGSVSGSHYYYYGLYPYDDGDGPYDAFDDSFSSQGQVSGRLQWDPSPAYRFVAGAEASSSFQSRYRLYDEEETYLDASTPYNSGALYAQAESQLLPQLSITAGARLDAIRDDVALSPRGGLVYTPDSKTALKIVAGTAFRAPSSFEEAYEDPFSSQVRATGLSPERIFSAEVIATREVTPGLRLEASVFATRIQDLIDTDFVDADMELVAYQNIGEAESVGAEIGASGVYAQWRGKASVGLQRATDPSEGATLSNAPSRVAKAAAMGPIGWGLALSVNALAESSRQTVYGTSTDPYLLLNAALSTRLFSGLGRLSLGARNALDADYALPGGFEHRQRAIPQPPREVYLRLDVTI